MPATEARHPSPTVRIRVRRALTTLLAIDAAVAGLYLVSVAAVRVFGWLTDEGRVARLLDMDSEVALPKWWAVLQLALAAVLALYVGWRRARERSRDRFGWTLLGMLVAVASIDEGIMLHELGTYPMQDLTGIRSGPLAAGWILPVAAILLLMAVVLAPWYARLPGRTKAGFALAAAVFVAGAVGFEMLAWTVATWGGPYDPLLHDLYVLGEETLELAGVSIFIAVVLAYLRDHVPGHAITLEIAEPGAGEGPARSKAELARAS